MTEHEPHTAAPSVRRAIAWVALAIAATAIFAIGYERSVDRGNDFDNFYDAGAAVWSDGALKRDKGTERYLPSFQVLMAPIGALPIQAAALVWLLITAASYVAVARLLYRVFGLSAGAQVPAWFCAAPFLVGNVTLGQNGPLLLALATGGVAAAAVGRDRLAGAALTLAGLIKVFPAALLAVPFVLGRVRGLLVGALAMAAMVAACMALAIGPADALQDCVRWVAEVRGEQTPQKLVEARRSLRYNNQSLGITLARTFGDFASRRDVAAPGSTQLATLPMSWVWAGFTALLAALATTLAVVALRVRARGAKRRDYLGLYALAVPAMLAVSPIVWTHYFVWLLPGWAYLAAHRATLWAVGTLSLFAIVSNTARGLGFHMLLALGQFVWIAVTLWREAPATIEHPASEAIAA